MEPLVYELNFFEFLDSFYEKFRPQYPDLSVCSFCFGSEEDMSMTIRANKVDEEGNTISTDEMIISKELVNEELIKFIQNNVDGIPDLSGYNVEGLSMQ